MLASIVPADVITAEVLGGDLDDGELLPEEERAISRAVATQPTPKHRGKAASV